MGTIVMAIVVACTVVGGVTTLLAVIQAQRAVPAPPAPAASRTPEARTEPTEKAAPPPEPARPSPAVDEEEDMPTVLGHWDG